MTWYIYPKIDSCVLSCDLPPKRYLFRSIYYRRVSTAGSILQLCELLSLDRYWYNLIYYRRVDTSYRVIYYRLINTFNTTNSKLLSLHLLLQNRNCYRFIYFYKIETSIASFTSTKSILLSLDFIMQGCVQYHSGYDLWLVGLVLLYVYWLLC